MKKRDKIKFREMLDRYIGDMNKMNMNSAVLKGYPTYNQLLYPLSLSIGTSNFKENLYTVVWIVYWIRKYIENIKKKEKKDAKPNKRNSKKSFKRRAKEI